MARAVGANGAATAENILDVAERLAQTRGFNGFSYAHIAEEVGITKASLHYHFPGKADLGKALVARYAKNFQAAIADIALSGQDALAKLRQYVQVYLQVLSSGRMCLCGMFAAEYATLPEPVQQELRRFFDENERWLTGVLEAGRRQGALQFEGNAKDVAGMLTGALEGSMLLARSYSDSTRFSAPVEQLLKTLEPKPRARAKAGRS
jgi:TetR/AcrR family transcriptional regulator, transcriptional repressor for nem operon